MLKSIELFSQLSEKELETLGLYCQERELQKGEFLFSKGDETNAIYIVKSGLLEVINEEKIIGFIKPQELVGEISIFDKINKVRTASVKAQMNSILIIIIDFSIKDLAGKYPKIMEKIQNIIKERKDRNEKISKLKGF